MNILSSCVKPVCIYIYIYISLYIYVYIMYLANRSVQIATGSLRILHVVVSVPPALEKSNKTTWPQARVADIPIQPGIRLTLG